jgi:hypothetical protein
MKTHSRLALAALAGAITMFVWGGVSHMLLLKGVGFGVLRREQPIIAELQRSIPRAGLYFFPSLDFERASASDTRAWEERFRRGPSGMIVFRSAGSEPVSGEQLALQFLSELLASVICALLLARLPSSYWARVLAAGLLGAFSCLSISALYWNWYGFPTAFFLAQCLDKTVGWSLAGAVIAALLAAPGRAVQHSSSAA